MSAGSIDPSLAKAAERKLEAVRTDDEHDQIDELTKLRTLLNKRLESEKSITRGGVDKLKQLKDKREIAHEKRLADQKGKLDQLLTDAFDIAKSNADNSTTFTSFFKTLQSKGIDLLSIIPSLKADPPPIPQQTAKHGILSYFQKPVEIPIPAPAPLPTPLHDIGLLLFYEAVATLNAVARKALLDILRSDKSNVIKYTAMNMQFGHGHPIMQLLNMTGEQHLAIDDIVNFLNEKEEVVDATDLNMMQKLMKITKDVAIQDKMLIQLTRHQDAMTISAQKGLQTLAKSKLEIEGNVLSQNVKNLIKSFANDFTKAVIYGIMSILILSGTTFGTFIFFPFIGALVISGALMCFSLYHLKKNNPNLYKGFWNISLHVGLRYDRRALAYKQNDLAGLVQSIFEKSSLALKHNTLYYQLYYIKQKLDKDPNATIQTKDLSPIVQAAYGQIIRTHRTQADQKQALDRLVEEYRIASFNNSSEINELNNRKIDLQREVTEKQQRVEEKAEKIRQAVWQDFKLAANIKGNIDYASNEIAKALTNAGVDPENDYMLEVEEILKRDFNIDLPQVREKLKQATTAETAVNPEELKKQVSFLLREFYTRTHDEYAKFNKREAE